MPSNNIAFARNYTSVISYVGAVVPRPLEGRGHPSLLGRVPYSAE